MSSDNILLIDYGMGDLGSIMNMRKHLEMPSSISDEPVEILQADKLILPGVGAFDNGK